MIASQSPSVLSLGIALGMACSGGGGIPGQEAEASIREGSALEVGAPEPLSPSPGGEARVAHAGGRGEGELCGGVAGIACSPGLTCVDDPGDGCDPSAGGADCAGICAGPSDPCAAVRCAEGTECQLVGTRARCVPVTDPCELVRCPAGTQCQSDGMRARCV